MLEDDSSPLDGQQEKTRAYHMLVPPNRILSGRPADSLISGQRYLGGNQRILFSFSIDKKCLPAYIALQVIYCSATGRASIPAGVFAF
jgi:hypothetical protein